MAVVSIQRGLVDVKEHKWLIIKRGMLMQTSMRPCGGSGGGNDFGWTRLSFNAIEI